MTKTFYLTGIYGLVDTYYRHVWLNIQEEDVAHYIRKIFRAKAHTTVFDLSQFDNYNDNTVDSECSLNWKISPHDYTSPLLVGSLTNSVFNQTQTQHPCNKLINEANHSPIPMEDQLDLQYQMMLYKKFISLITNNNYTNLDKTIISNQEFFDSVNEIFQANLYSNVIEEQLYQLAIKFENINGSFSILDLLGRHYE
jgi:hypothetical protein